MVFCSTAAYVAFGKMGKHQKRETRKACLFLLCQGDDNIFHAPNRGSGESRLEALLQTFRLRKEKGVCGENLCGFFLRDFDQPAAAAHFAKGKMGKHEKKRDTQSMSLFFVPMR